MSKKIVLSADEATATVSAATISDIFTTAISTNTVVTGTYGLVQKGLLVVAGMAAQSYRANGSVNFLKV